MNVDKWQIINYGDTAFYLVNPDADEDDVMQKQQHWLYKCTGVFPTQTRAKLECSSVTIFVLVLLVLHWLFSESF